MRIQRGKQNDWSKPFKLVFSKKQLDLLEGGDLDNASCATTEVVKKQTHQESKQQIVVPKIETVKRITQVKKFAKLHYNYLRIRDELNLPKLYYYELTQLDHSFLLTNQNKYTLRGKKILTTEFLQKVFVELQMKSGKDSTIPKAKKWILSFLEKEYKELMNMENYEQFAELVYSYWRSRRQQFNFPLLRPLWRPNLDQYNHLLAFKPREKQKRNLRRGNRLNDDQIGIQLAEEFENSACIVERIKTRQELKFQQIKMQIAQFHTQCKAVMSQSQTNQFLSFFQLDELKRQKLQQRGQLNREKIKEYQKEMQFLKKRKETNQQQESELYAQQKSFLVDSRQSTVNFLSTVASYAQTFNINYETLFNSSQPISNSYPTSLPVLKQASSTISVSDQNLKGLKINVNSILNQESPSTTLIQKGQILNVELYRQKDSDLLIKKWPCQEEELYSDNKQGLKQNRTHSTFLEYKRDDVCKYYFGDDDEGDYKDIRKIISVNFKKFLLMSKVIQ